MNNTFQKSFFKTLFTIVTPIIVTVVVFGVYFYDRLIEDKKAFLSEKAMVISSMISSVASFDRKFSHEKEFNNISSSATIYQIQNTFQSLEEKELQLEYLVGVVSDDKINFIAYSETKPASVKLEDITIAVPMRKALLGETGVIIGLDYNKNKVFASYHPIDNTKWGLVIKQPYSTHINYLYQTAWMCSFAIFILIVFLYIILKKYNLKNKKEIEYSEYRFQQLVESSGDFIWEVNADGVYTYVSKQVKNILGYTSEDIIGMTSFDLIKDEEKKRVIEIFKKNIKQKKKIINLENINIHKDGHKVYLLTSGSPFFDEKGEVLGYRGIDRDISEIKIQQKEIEKLAYYDALTGLSNRFNMNHRIEEEISFSQRNSTICALLFLDLDDFKIINDLHGHDHGDEILKVVSKRILKTLRNFDIAGRIGGDEFIILVRGTDKNSEEYKIFLETLAQRLIEEVSRPILYKGERHQVGISIGIALIPRDGESREEVLKHADMAMYEAKRLGKNQTVFFK